MKKQPWVQLESSQSKHVKMLDQSHRYVDFAILREVYIVVFLILVNLIELLLPHTSDDVRPQDDPHPRLHPLPTLFYPLQ